MLLLRKGTLPALIIASDGIWDALSSEMAAKSSHGLPAELAGKEVVKEALRTRGLKDDTTCIVVDIIPPDNELPPPPPPKKQNKLRAFLFRKRSLDSTGKLSKKLSAINIVEELFEEGSAMLAESGHYRPADDSLNSFLSFLKENGIKLDEVEVIDKHQDITCTAKL